jgi:uncharacterized protein (DUF362 family)
VSSGGFVEKVFIVKGINRTDAVAKLMSQYDLTNFNGKKIALKANFNSADPFPASTHIETLQVIVKGLKSTAPSEMALAERSGMGLTNQVLTETGVMKMSKQLSFKVVDLDDSSEDKWIRVKPEPGFHWQHGFWICKLFKEADKIVQTCCLKTHRFGGHFTMSLKNSIGLIGRYGPRDGNNYMADLHNSKYQRLMISEVNSVYRTDLIIMDATEAFVKGGPEYGSLVSPQLMLAARDRVDLDAVGVTILRSYGTTDEVSEGKIFEQQQIARGAELGVGVQSTSKIQLVPLNAESRLIAQDISKILALG